jgi:hypothetical protein
MTELETILRSHDQRDVQRALNELRKLPVGEAVLILGQLAGQSEPDYRCRALIGMTSISPESAEALALRLLGDAHHAVRWYACETLGELGSRSAIAPIAQLLATDPSGSVRHQAAFWLGEIGDESVLDVLIAAAERDTGTDHEGRPMRDTATKAIRKIRVRLAR